MKSTALLLGWSDGRHLELRKAPAELYFSDVEALKAHLHRHLAAQGLRPVAYWSGTQLRPLVRRELWAEVVAVQTPATAQ